MPSFWAFPAWIAPFEAILIMVLAGEAFSIPYLAAVSWVLLLPLLILASVGSLAIILRRMILLGAIEMAILVVVNVLLAYRAHLLGELSYPWLASLFIVPLNAGLIFAATAYKAISSSYEPHERFGPTSGILKTTWLLYLNAGLCAPFAALAFYSLFEGTLSLLGYGGFLIFNGSGSFFGGPVPSGIVIMAGFLAFQAGVFSGSRVLYRSTSLIERLTPILQLLVGLMIPVSVFLFVYPLWFPLLVGLGLSALRWHRAFGTSNHFLHVMSP